MKNTYKGSLQLFLAATIWGVAFVAQSVGNEYLGAFTFNFSRSVLACIFLMIVIIVMRKRAASSTKTNLNYPDLLLNEHNSKAEEKQDVNRTNSVPQSETGENRGTKKINKTLLTGGALCGTALFCGMSLQQVGLLYTSVGKAGFITAMYIILVPLVGIFFKHKTGMKLWIGIVLAVIGLYLLCVNESVSINKGDIIMVFAAFAFTAHILLIDYFSPKVNGVEMSCVQFFVCGLISFVLMLLLEDVQLKQIAEGWAPILYAGIMSSGVAYTLQIIGQKNVQPALASLIMSMESVISVIAGWILLGQTMTGKELFGCLMIFIAIILAQLPAEKLIVFKVREKN